MKPSPKEYEDAHARQQKIVEHLIEEGYAENEESANQIILGMSERLYNLIID